MVNKTKSSAFTLLELIFAIVIISIAVISLPRMIQVGSNSIENSFVQDAIYAASIELNLALSYRWDENSMLAGESYASALDLGTNDCNTITRLKPGHIAQPKHRRCIAGAANNGVVNDLTDFDLDDAQHEAQAVFSGISTHSYKQNFDSSIAVTDISPAGAQFIGVKQIDIDITRQDAANTPVTTLHAYASNIGEVEYHSWLFP